MHSIDRNYGTKKKMIDYWMSEWLEIDKILQ